MITKHYQTWLVGIVAIAGAVVLGSSLLRPSGAAPAAHPQANPRTPMQVPKGREVATLAAGCFWSMEAIFKQLRGVDSVLPGYGGGQVAKPSYEQVETGTTGHAETINIIFDPKVISYHQILQVLLTVRDPTTLNKQGPDAGPQYRSVIFYHTAEQQKIAQQTIGEINDSHIWKDPIVTRVEPFTNFYRAEDYHLNYYNLHPDEPYCAYVIAPEIANFRSKFSELLKPSKS